MENTKSFIFRVISFIVLLSTTVGADAAEVVYRIVEYNKTTGEFVLTASGMVPKDSWAYFENDYGATTGNRYNQIPRNKKATLYLEGWQGCKVKAVTLSMCSNNKSGQVGLSVSDGDTQLYTLRPEDFASDSWFGQWVSKDLNVYVDINKELDIPAFATDGASITLQGGTSEGSVYINSIAIEYDEPTGTELESPLGWTYEKLTKKSTLSDGDVLMIYRNGCAATDFDGMETSGYLDAMTIASTTDVTSPDVLRFTIGKTDGNMWTITDQSRRLLAAAGKQKLAWNEGNTQWAIELGYDGATITSGKADNGTLRYNVPENSYARFALYTSKTLALPFLYRRTKQKEAVLSQSITFAKSDMTASLDEGHIALTPSLLPTNATDRRIIWTSSNDGVATVNGGFVTLLSVGETTITARSKDGGAEASIRLVVAEPSAINSAKRDVNNSKAVYKTVDRNNIVIKKGNNIYGCDGAIR